MNEIECAWAQRRISEAFLSAYPDEPVAIQARWLEGQGQDAIANCILASDGAGAAGDEDYLLWLVDRKLDRANAIRLFWKLYRPASYAANHAGAIADTSDDPRLLAAAEVVIDRFERGYYPEGELGLSEDEARRYQLDWEGGLAAATGKGFDPDHHARYRIPAAFFRPLPGRPVADEPEIGSPPTLPSNGSPSETAGEVGAVIGMMQQRARAGSDHQFGTVTDGTTAEKSDRRDIYLMCGAIALVGVWAIAQFTEGG
ncbi:hypothetical protein [Marimonas arenosa]|uniref:Transmembrane protein n=1 Tax=Marimonas arenosa TaxID=1795305 RepID=A0AAE3WBB8_9RHOB|nr:hypothetical protein [Marimonas arenosa]MDQ2088498.1 hypothetical protein [Marimonas arenosa]